jgi:putative FmdB family regulatory protein
MPLYEFECKTCGTRFEKLILGSARPNPPCPSCDARDVDKLYSAFGVGSSNGRRSGGSSPVTFSGG